MTKCKNHPDGECNLVDECYRCPYIDEERDEEEFDDFCEEYSDLGDLACKECGYKCDYE